MQAPHENHVILLGSSARAAAASATAAGLQVTALDQFGDADLKEICQCYQPLPQNHLPVDFLRSVPPSTIVPLGGCERWVDAIASLENHHRIAGATAKQWRLVNQRTVLAAIAQAAAIHMPESRASGDDLVKSARDAAAASPPRWLVKRRYSCGGLGVRWCESGPTASDEYYQRWVKGVSLGVSYLATGTEVHLLGVCRGLKFRTRSHPAIYAGSCGPIPMLSEWTAKLVQLGNAAADRLQLRGLFNVDLVLHPADGFYLLEINPRYTASMELLEPPFDGKAAQRTPLTGSEMAVASSLLAAHLECFSGPDAQKKPLHRGQIASSGPGRIRCKRVIFTRERTVFDGETRRRIQRILAAHAARWADIPVEGATVLPHRPLFSLFTEADTAADAMRRAGRIVRTLRAT